MPKVKGFNEKFGLEVKRQNYVDNVLTSIAYKFGYEQIQIPLIEYATSFDEDVVGKSPWPEWNSKGIFSFYIQNYHNSYGEEPIKERVLLIPEGTTSVTRWLGDKINSSAVSYPIKMFYNLSCYRNELINELSKTKRREFHQFGYEILGTNCIQSDAEILLLVFESLKKLNVDETKIRLRVNDIGIYKKLCEESNITYEESINLKEKLDYLAECKAGKHPEKKEETYNSIIKYLEKCELGEDTFKKWLLILNEESGTITPQMEKTFGEDYKSMLDGLKSIRENFKRANKNIFIDLCVIRSHEYYTGLSFETDVLYGDKKFIEIAGGGRFDRLVSNFIVKNAKSEVIVPCTGFAFGTERLIGMLKELSLLDKDYEITMLYNFNTQFNYNLPKDDSVSSYLELYETLENSPQFNIYINKNSELNQKLEAIKMYETEEGFLKYVAAIDKIGLWKSEKILVEKYVDKKAKILDLGCGAGRTSFGLYKLGYKSITALDLSKRLIEYAREYNNKKGYEIKFLLEDASNLPFEENSYDFALYSFNGLQLIPSKKNRINVLEAVYRILKKGSYFIFTAHDRDNGEFKNFWQEEKHKWETSTQDKKLEEYGDMLIEEYGGSGFIHYSSIEELKEMVTKVGFQIVEVVKRSDICDENENVKEFSSDTCFWVLKK